MLTTTSTSLRRLPMFFAYCPDVKNGLKARLAVRERHLERWKKDLKAGRAEFGLAFKPPQPTALPSGIDPSTPNMAGSTMIFRAESLDSAWERIKTDVYWTEGVWDREGCVLREYVHNPLYSDVD